MCWMPRNILCGPEGDVAVLEESFDLCHPGLLVGVHSDVFVKADNVNTVLSLAESS